MTSLSARWVVLLLCIGCERSATTSAHAPPACESGTLDTARLAVIARDTVARLRARPQRVSRVSPVPAGGLELRTEDSSPGAFHDGGLVTFDCAGEVSFVWLDGG